MSIADVQLRSGNGVPVARVVGEVDTSNARHIGAQLDGAVSNAGPGLVVDLSELGFLDSSGIGVLFGLGRRLTERRQQLRLAVPADSPVRRVLTVVRMDRIAPVHETVGEAIAAMPRGARGKPPADAGGEGG